MALVYKSPRYVTLLGDPIEQGYARNVLLSDDMLASVTLGTLFLSAVHDVPHAATEASINGLPSSVLARTLLERWTLNSFSNKTTLVPFPYISNEKLKSLSIDKTPEASVAVESLSKHGTDIKAARRRYAILAFAYSGLLGKATLQTMVDHNANMAALLLAHNIGSNMASYSRIARGLYRFNQLAKGEWAIISTPEQQETIRTPIEVWKSEEAIAPV